MDRPTNVTVVIKRDARKELFDKEKLVENTSTPSREDTIATNLTTMVQSRLGLVVQSADIERAIIDAASAMSSIDVAYGDIACQLELEGIYENTEDTFSGAMLKAKHLLSDSFSDLVRMYATELDNMVVNKRDRLLQHSSLRAVQANYALQDRDTTYESPQFVWLRTSVQLHGSDMANVKSTYDVLSQLYVIHSSPTLFNSGRKNASLSSCYLLPANVRTGSIFDTLSKVAKLAETGGGVGIGLHEVPARGKTPSGTPRPGLAPIIKLLDSAVNVINQANPRRATAVSAYVEVWHADLYRFLGAKRNRGAGSGDGRHMFFSLMIPDLFMSRVAADQDWSLFCPSDAPLLTECVGNEFVEEYGCMEISGIRRHVLKAREVWKEILATIIETGGPSILFKDAINNKSNESHRGVITHSNLCTEITQYCDSNETAVCTLASVVLTSFIGREGHFDFEGLDRAVRLLVFNLNRAIVSSTFPTKAVKLSAVRSRSIGIGIQGFADALSILEIPWDSPEARKFNIDICERVYYAAVDESCELTPIFGIYPTFAGSHYSRGVLQPDLWGVTPSVSRLNWKALRDKVRRGVANALTVAYMPTAGTSVITGCTESFDPYHSLIYTRKITTGEHVTLPLGLLPQLSRMNGWDEDVRDRMIADGGSIQNIDCFPEEFRRLYTTAWEINPETIIRMAVDRGPYTCQSQSLTLYMDTPSIPRLSNLLFQGWKGGLKTGLYYLRTKPASRPLPITIPVRLWPPTFKATQGGEPSTQSLASDPLVAPEEPADSSSSSSSFVDDIDIDDDENDNDERTSSDNETDPSEEGQICGDDNCNGDMCHICGA